MKDITWKHVVIAVAFLGAFVALAVSGKDSGALVAGVLALAGGLGWLGSQVASAKTQANGNLDLAGLVREQGGHIREMASMLAQMQPPVEDVRPVSPA